MGHPIHDKGGLKPIRAQSTSNDCLGRWAIAERRTAIRQVQGISFAVARGNPPGAQDLGARAVDHRLRRSAITCPLA